MSDIQLVLSQVARGKSLGRGLQNVAFQEVELSGCGIDLGSKSGAASYYQFLKIADGTEIIYTDLHPTNEQVLKLDLEKSFPVEDESQDFLILSNVLEHLYDYKTCVSETYRILKKGGKLVGSVPFIHHIHGDPDDYFRYTKSSLTRIFKEAGYEDIEVKGLGYGPVTTGVSMITNVSKFPKLNSLIYMASISFDHLFQKLFQGALSKLELRHRVFGKVLKYNSNTQVENYPLHYFFVCKKAPVQV